MSCPRLLHRHFIGESHAVYLKHYSLDPNCPCKDVSALRSSSCAGRGPHCLCHCTRQDIVPEAVCSAIEEVRLKGMCFQFMYYANLSLPVPILSSRGRPFLPLL